MKIPKGGLHNINQSSQANINDSWNVLATDENNAVLIAVDKCGTKKTVGDTTEIKNSIQALEQENIEQDGRLENLEYGLAAKLDKGTYTGNASDLKTEIDGKANSSHTHPISEVTNLQTTLDNKVDKVIGKQLSTEDYTTAEKNKLAGIQEGAEVNVNADWNATSGDAHILNKPSTFTPSAHTHPISQVDNLQTTLDGKESTISTGTTGQYWRGDKTWQTLDKNAVGLSNVDNTSDLNKPISTATQQALNSKLDKGTYTGTASDLKSLIDTKADLVSGKVPKSQSQPSTMVMDNSTYVITFTDATGAVQTIDLPLQSIFQDANYDAATKSLIVTLQNGTTRTIPLTDLVDLPEIILSTSNPAVTPTTGQKVYFNTDLGKVWFNVGGTWSGGYSLINTITTAVTSTTTVGAINAGDIIPAGTTIQELAELLLNKTFYPTFVNPTFGLTNNAGLREVGSSFNVTLTFNFDRGKILGKLDNSLWNPTMLQDYRAGTAISYLLNNVSGANNSASFNVTTILGTNTLNGCAPIA